MKKYLPLIKFEVGISTIPFLLIVLLTGYYKLFFTYFLVNLIHELGHVIMALFFKVRVNKIKLNIFGFSADIENIDYLKRYKQILIIIMGPLTYFISLYLIKELYLYDFISLVTYYKALSVNKYLVLFNLLPIYPLDGGRLLKVISDKLFTFKVSRIITYSVSFLMMIGFVIYTGECKQYLMYIFLIGSFITNILSLDKEWKKFLLSRYYLNNNYRDKLHSHHDLYIQKNNYLLINKNIFTEKEAIKELLMNHSA